MATLPTSQLTLLSSMASSDFEESVRLHRDWGLSGHLRDGIYGKRVEELDLDAALEAKRSIDALGLEVYCVSTNVFVEDVAHGEAALRAHLDILERAIEVAGVLRPRLLRLNAANFAERAKDSSAISVIKEHYPWFVDVYRAGVDMVAARGMVATIENEAFDCCLSKPEEFVEFFDWLERPEGAGLSLGCPKSMVDRRLSLARYLPSAEVLHRVLPREGRPM